MEYTLVTDDAGNRYIIPLDKAGEWDTFLDWVDQYDVPAWATFVDGGIVIFKEYRVGE
jgi:hypothetical protein